MNFPLVLRLYITNHLCLESDEITYNTSMSCNVINLTYPSKIVDQSLKKYFHNAACCQDTDIVSEPSPGS